ncbi:hypothetical protein [Methylorubrum zatmanii]|uniref:AbrB family transcriptional regulator n=1 Tax=Methylorubrum zatmanii TaxID=29429 RepID=A0ABW1WTP9_9HYPH|nr:hypothetical protein [Methylorubrum zatmanii]
MKREVKKIDNSTGVILPKDLSLRLDLQQSRGCMFPNGRMGVSE